MREEGTGRSALENSETHFSPGEKPFSRLSCCAACLPRRLIYNFYPRLYRTASLAQERRDTRTGVFISDRPDTAGTRQRFSAVEIARISERKKSSFRVRLMRILIRNLDPA